MGPWPYVRPRFAFWLIYQTEMWFYFYSCYRPGIGLWFAGFCDAPFLFLVWTPWLNDVECSMQEVSLLASVSPTFQASKHLQFVLLKQGTVFDSFDVISCRWGPVKKGVC